jgi:hypothetical protein
LYPSSESKKVEVGIKKLERAAAAWRWASAADLQIDLQVFHGSGGVEDHSSIGSPGEMALIRSGENAGRELFSSNSL